MRGSESWLFEFWRVSTFISWSVPEFPLPSQIQARGVEQVILNEMSAVKLINPKAEVARAAAALQLNINAAKGLQEVLKTNLGPKGTMKM